MKAIAIVGSPRKNGNTEILATHKPKPLTLEQDKAIDEILEEARSFYREKGLM